MGREIPLPHSPPHGTAGGISHRCMYAESMFKHAYRLPTGLACSLHATVCGIAILSDSPARTVAYAYMCPIARLSGLSRYSYIHDYTNSTHFVRSDRISILWHVIHADRILTRLA